MKLASIALVSLGALALAFPADARTHHHAPKAPAYHRHVLLHPGQKQKAPAEAKSTRRHHHDKAPAAKGRHAVHAPVHAHVHGHKPAHAAKVTHKTAHKPAHKASKKPTHAPIRRHHAQ